MVRSSRVGRYALACLAASSLALTALSAASAHPFGDPQTLELSADGSRVQMRWTSGGADDLTLLGVSLGILPEDRVLLDGAVAVRDGDAAALAADPAFADYLTERIRVSVAGQRCPARVTEVADLLDEGAVVTARCPRAGAVEVTATVLTDLHPAYRLLAAGPDGQRAQYDVDRPTHTWTLGTAADGADPDSPAAETALGQSAGLQIGAVLAGVAAMAGLVLAGVRRGRRRAEAT